MSTYYTNFLQGDLPKDDDFKTIKPYENRLPDLNTAFCSVYAVGNSTLSSLSKFLWSDNFLNQVKRVFSDPMQAIIGVHAIYLTPEVSDYIKEITIGHVDTGIEGKFELKTTTQIFDFGSVNIGHRFLDADCLYLDYEPYTKIKLFLPYIGMVDLNTNEVMGKRLNIKYEVDFITGSFTAYVLVQQPVVSNPTSDNEYISCALYQYGGNCAYTIPISTSSYMGLVGSLIGVAGSTVATIASGGATAPMLIGTAANTASSLASGINNVAHTGGFSANTGATGYPNPFLVVTRPYVVTGSRDYIDKNGDHQFTLRSFSSDAKNINDVNGTSTNYITSVGAPLSGLHGFTIIKNFKLGANLAGSIRKDEYDEIIDLMESGVLFPSRVTT